MFQIKEVSTGTIKCNWRGEFIKKKTLRLSRGEADNARKDAAI